MILLFSKKTSLDKTLSLVFIFFISFIFTVNIQKSYVHAVEPGCYINLRNVPTLVVWQLKTADPDSNGCEGTNVPVNALEHKCYYLDLAHNGTEFNCDLVATPCEINDSSDSTKYYAYNQNGCEKFYEAYPKHRPDPVVSEPPDPVVGGAGDTNTENPNPDDVEKIQASDELHQADDSESGKFFSYLTIIFTVFSALAGVAMVTSLVVAGIQYATAGDNAGAISKAKSRIVYTLITLLLYVMLFYIITWLIPSDIVV